MNLQYSVLAIALISLGGASCSIEMTPVDTSRSGTYDRTRPGDVDDADQNQNTADQSVDEEGNDSNDENDDDDDEGSSNNNEDGNNPQAGLTFFENQVVAAFSNACTGCHADPRFMVEVQGPLTIFTYDQMRPYLEDGVSSTNNKLINKVQGILNHTGGDRCLAGLNSSPCNEIVQWWETEFGDGDTTGGPVARVGELTSISDLGRVTGWAMDPDTATTSVRLYANGPADSGDFIMEADANLTGFDGGNGNSHAFAVTLPEAYRDGTPFDLYAYALVDGNETLLPGAPKNIVAYAPSDGGRTFFENTVAPALTGRCGACHGISYEQQFANLLQASPAKGGTATNNLLYNKPAGTVNHGGGTFCNGGGSPCAEIREWWELEFN